MQVLYRWPSSLTMRRQSWKVNQHLRGFFMAEVYGEKVGSAGLKLRELPPLEAVVPRIPHARS